jgi:hypothetical protein
MMTVFSKVGASIAFPRLMFVEDFVFWLQRPHQTDSNANCGGADRRGAPGRLQKPTGESA